VRLAINGAAASKIASGAAADFGFSRSVVMGGAFTQFFQASDDAGKAPR
jgi:hypothetical protein